MIFFGALRSSFLSTSVRAGREYTTFIVEGAACLNWHGLRKCLDVRATVVLGDDCHQLLDKLRITWREIVSFLS